MTVVTVTGAVINRTRRIEGSVRTTSRSVAGQVYRATREGGAPYEGPYEVTPEFSAQTLPTKGKSMRDDVTVHAMPVSRTTNPQGGKTVYIGEVN